ncbi:MAG TPA: DHH family phosphoesterase [Methanomicrobiales archaeon]|nr:DHH family phosphoesterase [Methanomicrobiales archaeon]
MDLLSDAAAAADLLADAGGVTLVSHIDADGICSEAIVSLALGRLGIPVKSIFVRQLEPAAMATIPRDRSFKVFTDLGSGQQNLLAGHGLSEDQVLILDHHVGQPVEGKSYREVNALAYGHGKLAASGVAYLVARALDPKNGDLAKLAVIGNVGDMMARTDLGLTGPSREIAEDGVRHGSVEVRKKDLNCYGISTRPIHLCLAYSDDPFIPGITGSPNSALQFLERLGVPLKHPSGRWLVWEEIPVEDRRKVISALAQQLIANGRAPDRLLAETYLFPSEREKPLRNASEFATVLNACGRWSESLVGSRICKGDRGIEYRKAERMLTHHRGMIRDLLQFILEKGVTEISHLQHIHVGDRFPDTIIGIGAGMALSKLNRKKPILIMAEMTDDPLVTKVSMRTNEEMVANGTDLQQAIVEAAAEVGGSGGGHRIAAGAFVPKELEARFIDCVNRRLERQDARPGQGHR